MKLGTKEYYEMLDQFEKDYSYPHTAKKENFPRETNEQTIKNGYYYQNGEINDSFRMWQRGYSYGRSVYMNQ